MRLGTERRARSTLKDAVFGILREAASTARTVANSIGARKSIRFIQDP
jgi:hypothetical protein